MAVTGTAPITLQWRKAVGALPPALITGAMGSTYTLTSSTPSDDGAQFSVTATNAFGSVTSSVATLTVVSQRLVVASSAGVLMWNNPQNLSVARAADVVLPVTGARAVTMSGSQLFVLGTSGVTVFTDVLAATPTTAPAFVVPPSALTPTPAEQPRRLTPVSAGAGAVGLFVWGQAGAWYLPAPLSASTVSIAAFQHPWNQLPSFHHARSDGTPGGGRLFMGQISGAGLLAWNDPTLATGTPAHSFATPGANVWALTSSRTRLAGGGSFGGVGSLTPGIGLWNNLIMFSAPRAPDVMLASATATFSSSDFVADLASDGFSLAAAVQNPGANRLLVWSNVEAATATTTPNYSGTVSSQPRRVVVAGARTYVLTSTTIEVFSQPIAGSLLLNVVTLGGSTVSFSDLAVTF